MICLLFIDDFKDFFGNSELIFLRACSINIYMII